MFVLLNKRQFLQKRFLRAPLVALCVAEQRFRPKAMSHRKKILLQTVAGNLRERNQWVGGSLDFLQQLERSLGKDTTFRFLRRSELTRGSGFLASRIQDPVEDCARICAAGVTGQSAQFTDLLRESLSGRLNSTAALEIDELVLLRRSELARGSGFLDDRA